MIKHPGVVVAHACKPSPGQAEGGGGLPGSSKPARATEEHLFLKSQSKANPTKNPNDSQAHEEINMVGISMPGVCGGQALRKDIWRMGSSGEVGLREWGPF